MLSGMQRTATLGSHHFVEVVDLEMLSLKRQLEEIDPNLMLARHPRGGIAVLWNGPTGQWHTVCVHKNPKREDLQALPMVLRQRDNASPVNSRQSAFERDLAKMEAAEAAREREMQDAMFAETERLVDALRKDMG